jgi:O-antigen/teichoic acid export membrane protein
LFNLKNIFWSFAGQLSYIFLYFVFNLILSRLLTPAEFGVFAISNTFIILWTLLNDFGIQNYLITSNTIDKELCTNVFYFNLFLVAIIYLLLYLTAPFFAKIYQDDRLADMVRFSGITLLIDALAKIPTALATREVNFFRLFVVKSVSLLLAGLISVYMAISGSGIYSLLAQPIFFSIFSLLILFYFYPFVPYRKISYKSWNHLFRFSIPLLLSSLIQYLSRNIDNLIIGWQFGTTSLGFYNRAYTLMQMPIQNISYSVSQLLFPEMARIQSDSTRLSTLYKKVLSGVALFSFPIMAYLFVFADELIFFLYGTGWAEVSNLLRIFCLVGMLESIIYPIGSLLMATGNTMTVLRFMIWPRLLTVIMILIGSSFSVRAVAFCYLAVTILIAPYSIYFAASMLKTRFTKIALPLVRILLCSLAPALLVYLIKLAPLEGSVFLLLFVSFLIFLIVYTFFIYYCAPTERKEFLFFLKNSENP